MKIIKFALPVLAVLINIYPASFTAHAQDLQAGKTCRISDPTGTPLNIRSSPNGGIIGRIGNGRQVSIEGTDYDRKGKPWVVIAVNGQTLGYVLREFVGCYN